MTIILIPPVLTPSEPFKTGVRIELYMSENLFHRNQNFET